MGVALGLPASAALASGPPSSPDLFINEIHYDNVGADVNEGIEVAGPAGTDLSSFSLDLYNGYDGTMYGTVALSGVLADQQSGYGTRFFAIPGLQNGAPDGVALSDPQGVLETLAYEGTFSAVNGPAAGLTLHDIGRFEPPSTPRGDSLQLQGTGTTPSALHWSGPIRATPGEANTDESFQPAAATTSPPSSAPTTPSASAPGSPAPLAAPVLTGDTGLGDQVSCSTGSWTNDPGAYAYQWSRDGGAIPGATSPEYQLTSADAGHSLTCSVTATNASGGQSSTSDGILIPISSSQLCPQATGQLSSSELGPLSLGETRTRARQSLPRYVVTHNQFDRFCLSPSRGIRAGYPSATLLHSLPGNQRRKIRGRVILALTANPHYSLRGITPGMPLSALTTKVRLTAPFHVGLNIWYLLPGPTADEVLKVQDHTIQEIGIASKTLTQSRGSQARYLRSFN